MITHIVMWKLKDETGPAGSPARKAACLKIKQTLEALIPLIPQIEFLEVGINALNPQANYDVVLNSRFLGPNELQFYQDHPDHQKAAAVVRELVQARACVDYEA